MYNLKVPHSHLREQPAYEFRYECRVGITDLHHTGRLCHAAFAKIAHEARVQLFHTLGAAEHDLGDAKTGIIMGDLVIHTTGDASLFDRLQVESHVGDVSRSGFRLFHRFMKDGAPIALVETGLITFNYTKRTIAPVPEPFRKALHEHAAPKNTAAL